MHLFSIVLLSHFYFAFTLLITTGYRSLWICRWFMFDFGGTLGFVARHGMVALQGIGGTKPGRIPGTRVVAGWVHTS